MTLRPTSGSMMGVTVRLHSNQAKGGDAEGDTFVDMVTVEYENPDRGGAQVMRRFWRKQSPISSTSLGLMLLTYWQVTAGITRSQRWLAGDDKLYGGPGGGADIHVGRTW